MSRDIMQPIQMMQFQQGRIWSPNHFSLSKIWNCATACTPTRYYPC